MQSTGTQPFNDSQIAAMNGEFGAEIPSGNAFEPIESMFSPGQNMNWQSWDQIIQDQPDPNLNNFNLGWPSDLGNMDFPLSSDSSDANIDPSVNFSAQTNQSNYLVGAGIIPFQFTAPDASSYKF